MVFLPQRIQDDGDGTARHRGVSEKGIDPAIHRQGDGEGVETSSCKTNLKVGPKNEGWTNSFKV